MRSTAAKLVRTATAKKEATNNALMRDNTSRDIDIMGEVVIETARHYWKYAQRSVAECAMWWCERWPARAARLEIIFYSAPIARFAARIRFSKLACELS